MDLDTNGSLRILSVEDVLTVSWLSLCSVDGVGSGWFRIFFKQELDDSWPSWCSIDDSTAPFWWFPLRDVIFFGLVLLPATLVFMFECAKFSDLDTSGSFCLISVDIVRGTWSLQFDSNSCWSAPVEDVSCTWFCEILLLPMLQTSVILRSFWNVRNFWTPFRFLIRFSSITWFLFTTLSLARASFRRFLLSFSSFALFFL